MFNPRDDLNDPKIAALIDKAHAGAWSPAQAIDWSRPVELPPGVSSEVYIDMVSQLYYSEEAAIEVLGRLIAGLPHFQARSFLCTQAVDEARHAQCYRMYLERLGDIAPIDPGLRDIFDAALSYSGPPYGLVVAMNLVMEHEALGQQKKRIESLPCPLFNEINRTIIRDESRHAAFGVLYLTRIAPELTPESKRTVLTWIGGLWKLWIAANQGRYTSPAESVLRLGGEELSNRWDSIRDAMLRVGLLDHSLVEANPQ